MLRITVLVILVKFAACVFNEDLHAKFLTMPHHEFIDYFNKQNYSFKITNYGSDVHRTLGAHINHDSLSLFPKQPVDDDLLKDLPLNFDSREKWPDCKTIKEINNQGDCGSCWMFGTANTASDRTCIHKNIHVHLAEQEFKCIKDDVCRGGDPGKAFQFWRDTGLVSQECKPYDIQQLKEGKCELHCVNQSKNYENDKHFAETVYQIGNDKDAIKAEIFHKGSIQAAFKVFEDFDDYKTGVYEHTYGLMIGGHSVRVIGYGIEEGKEFWLVANSWGTTWGLNGYVKIKINDADLAFEDYLFSGMPKN